MAGFFGLFNYNKEGPGVEKNAPKKRAFIVFFEIYGRKFWNLFYANLLFLLTNLPIVTRGLADVGLTKITRNYAREKHAFVKEDFFETVKRNWKQALSVSIINLLVTALLIFNVYYYFIGLYPEFLGLFGADVSNLTPLVPTLFDYFVIFLTAFGYMIFTWMKYYIPLMVVTFKFDNKTLYMNAFKFAIVGFKQNMLISVVLIALYFLVTVVCLSVAWQVAVLILIIVSLFLPSFRSLLIQFTIFPLVQRLIIDPYYKEHPEADKQLRRDLNLDVEETEAEKEEAVFDDARPVEKENPTFPRQYSAEEMNRIRRISEEDEDTTI